MTVDHPSDQPWTPEALETLTRTLKDNDVALVLDHRAPSDALTAAVAQSGSQLLVVNADGADPVAELQATIEAIIKALNKA